MIEHQPRSEGQATPPTRARRDPPTSEGTQSIAISRALGKVVVTIRGSVDRDLTSVLHQLLVDLVDNQGNLDVALESRDTSSIAVESLELIANAAERVRGRGGALSFSRPPPALRAMLDDMGLA